MAKLHGSPFIVAESLECGNVLWGIGLLQDRAAYNDYCFKKIMTKKKNDEIR